VERKLINDFFLTLILPDSLSLLDLAVPRAPLKQKAERLTAATEAPENTIYEKASCPSPVLDDRGQMRGKCSPGVVGQKCYFNCIVGYRLKGSRSLTCLPNGVWDADVPACQFKS
jgi:hypothetical protein